MKPLRAGWLVIACLPPTLGYSHDLDLGSAVSEELEGTGEDLPDGVAFIQRRGRHGAGTEQEASEIPPGVEHPDVFRDLRGGGCYGEDSKGPRFFVGNLSGA